MAGLAVIAVVALAVIADARPGGGHSSSGGGRSSGGGGYRSSSSSSSSSRSSSSSSGGYRSGGGNHGATGVVILLVVGALVVAGVVAVKQSSSSWTSGSLSLGLPAVSSSEPAAPRPPPDLSALVARDPDLSVPVLEDFVYQLFSAAHRVRATPAELAKLQPYLSPTAIEHLQSRGPAPSQVVIGTLRLASYRVDPNKQQDRIAVHIEATLHTSPPSYVTESWLLVRSTTAVSKPPATTRTWPCPNCGAPWQGNDARTCQHCGETMQTGKFDWCVNSITVKSAKNVLASLTGTVEEYGNDLPTVYRGDAMQLMAAITADDPQVTFEAVRARVALIYARLNEGWNASDLTPVRGLTTTALRDYMQYWLDEYRRQGLHNHLDNAKIEYIELAKVTRDRHFDTITMRVRAGGNDYTKNAKGAIVGGSTKFFRRYTEYWTVMRASSRRGPVTTTPSCPNCGAALAISDTGTCTHCQATVENGQFDWILSKIEQDDTYAG